jgi:serine/threonine protein kinase
VRVDPEEPLCSDIVGVIYWQAPEVRAGAYDPRKVDVFSLGATVWEMAEHAPPFSDVTDVRELGEQWPEPTNADAFSRSFHDFLLDCSSAASSRPDAKELLHVRPVSLHTRRAHPLTATTVSFHS